MTTKRIPDARLAEMATEHEELKAEINQMKADLAEIDAKIIAEMDRRNTRVIENSGVRITVVQAETMQYDWDVLKTKLKPAQWKLCVKEVPDTKGLSAAVQSGVIDVRLVTRHSKVIPKAPYVTVSEVPQ